ncbi:hypothetical protein [Ekhidna sp.]|uniref:hypothetical protein n=1 Tax=Ekhidna sp. TaxID=2608089 RepID=UPI003B590425
MNNNILKLATFAARFILLIDVLFGALFVFLMIARPLQLEFLEYISIEGGNIIRFGKSTSPWEIPLSEYNGFFFYSRCIKALIIAGILYRIIQVAIRIIQSISNLDTFRIENVKSFRLMGKLFLIWFALDIISLHPSLSGSIVELSTNLVFWALICFVLAEIFSEGNKLMEDNKLTI